MSTHPNAQLMEKVYAAFGAGDTAKAATYWTEDAVHHYPGRNALAGSHRGLDETTAFATKMFELTNGRIRMQVVDIGASDDYAYARVQTQYERDGKSLDMPFVNIMRITDGKISEFWTYPDDQHAVDEFWS
jgi:ketosteroid isomerase-like protein